MKKIFVKNETLFCILLIVLYVSINSYCMQSFGLSDYRSVIINTYSNGTDTERVYFSVNKYYSVWEWI